MQQRQLVAGVAGDKDMRHAGLHRQAVGQRHASSVELQAGIFEAQPIDVGAAAGGGQHVVHQDLLRLALQILIADKYAVAFALHHLHFHVGVEVELFPQRLRSVIAHGAVGQRPDGAADAEDFGVDAEAVQRLPQLQPDHAGAEYRHGLRQVIPVEQIVIDDQAIAQFIPRRRPAGARAGGDHDALRHDARMVIDLQRVVVDKAGIALNFVGGRDLVHAFQHEADETIAFAFDARHHLASVDTRFAGWMHAKARRTFDLMHRFGGGDQ
ncbi:Uncharacterised protein [Acinetobacter baumannii]|nr:Uncharacterised protein [Acinetobacter baumannii]